MSGAELSAQLARALTLSSFSRSGVAVTFGSSGVIGGAMVDQLAADGSFDNVMGFSRSSLPEIELLVADGGNSGLSSTRRPLSMMNGRNLKRIGAILIPRSWRAPSRLTPLAPPSS